LELKAAKLMSIQHRNGKASRRKIIVEREGAPPRHMTLGEFQLLQLKAADVSFGTSQEGRPTIAICQFCGREINVKTTVPKTCPNGCTCACGKRTIRVNNVRQSLRDGRVPMCRSCYSRSIKGKPLTIRGKAKTHCIRGHARTVGERCKECRRKPPKQRKQSTKCSKGHAMTPENIGTTVVRKPSPGHRVGEVRTYCKVCNRARARLQKKRKAMRGKADEDDANVPRG
jgi:hypothetical protein